MQTVPIKQVDAFTRKPFSGNPAAVVVGANGLSGTDMQKIAREMNVSETVFVLDPESEETDLRLRWFTPSQEVDLCGHATIAAFHVLAEEGAYGLEVEEPQSFIVETRSGNLVVDVEWREFHPYIKFSLPIPEFFPYPGDIAHLCGALGLSEIELSQKVKPQITGNGYCYIPLKTYDSLKTLDPNISLLRKINEQHDIVGFAVVTDDTGDKNVNWHMRFFAPSLGVLEDPVTGSANGPMAAFLLHSGFLDKSKQVFTFRADQGRFVNRPGTVTVYMQQREGIIEELQIAGQAVTVMTGNLFMTANQPEHF